MMQKFSINDNESHAYDIQLLKYTGGILCVCGNKQINPIALYCRFELPKNRNCGLTLFNREKKIGIYQCDIPQDVTFRKANPGVVTYSFDIKRLLYHKVNEYDYIFLACSAICPDFLKSFKEKVKNNKYIDRINYEYKVGIRKPYMIKRRQPKKIIETPTASNSDDVTPDSRDYIWCHTCDNFICERRFYNKWRDIHGYYFKTYNGEWQNGVEPYKILNNDYVCKACYTKYNHFIRN